MAADDDEISNENEFVCVTREISKESSGYDSGSDAECACGDIEGICGLDDPLDPEEKNETPNPPWLAMHECEQTSSRSISPTAEYQQTCCTLLDSYYWQRPIPNDSLYHPFYSQFQAEILNNPYYRFTAVNFNNLRRKCQWIRSQFLGQKIRSLCCGAQGSHKWTAGETISEIELFAVKMYTDYESCQFELKKCYRAPINANELEYLAYEQRLCYFGQWRRLLDRTILKYGKPLRDRVFYHGIDKIMKLNMHPTHQCAGPISATPDLSVARGFATKKGFILKMCSRYPRLDTDYYFDASTISSFPDEKEYLIGFAYTRILKVKLGQTDITVDQLRENQLLPTLTCFIISSLLRNHLYSYDSSLELLFKALLIRDDAYHHDEELDRLFKHIRDRECRQIELQKLLEISKLIPDVIVEEFQRFRTQQRVLKLDTISDGMKCVFCNQNGQICLDRVLRFVPNIQELHLTEEYHIDDSFVSAFVVFVEANQIKLHTLKVMKFSFQGKSEQFRWRHVISDSNQCSLTDMGWCMSEKHKMNSYIFKLINHQKKNMMRHNINAVSVNYNQLDAL